MQFGAVILRLQFKSPKIATIRAGADLAQAETGGAQAGPNPSLALRKEVCRKVQDAVTTGATSIELTVVGGVIVESPVAPETTGGSASAAAESIPSSESANQPTKKVTSHAKKSPAGKKASTKKAEHKTPTKKRPRKKKS